MGYLGSFSGNKRRCNQTSQARQDNFLLLFFNVNNSQYKKLLLNTYILSKANNIYEINLKVNKLK